MTNLVTLADNIRGEIAMSDQCLNNLLARLDEDIARSNERKQQLIEEFSARRASLMALIGEDTNA